MNNPLRFCESADVQPQKTVLLLGSAPVAVRCRPWPKSDFFAIVAINNAWRLRDDWDFLIAPDDFPTPQRPATLGPGQKLIGSAEYVPASNRFGGIFYCGGTMAFTTAYWALAVLKPTVLAFLGCDMIYPAAGQTHFYGRGTADPLREDLSLRSLEAKSARLMLHAARLGCACVRLSSGPSRLVFPCAEVSDLSGVRSLGRLAGEPVFDTATAQEQGLGYRVASGRYWQHTDQFCPSEVDALDGMWLRAAGLA